MASTMKKPSKTAELVCAARAGHTLHEKNPIYSDPLAIELCRGFWKWVAQYRSLNRFMMNIALKKISPIIPEIIVRAKFCREVFDDYARNGLKQFVILGAGYDSLPYGDEFPTDVKVFEIDLAVTQTEKLARLTPINKNNLPHICYLPADLSVESLEKVLGNSEFDFSKKALLSWFGVTYYIPKEGYLNTLRFVKEHLAPGSAIIFDFLLPPDDIPGEWKVVAEKCGDFVAIRGEPWINRMNESDIMADLDELGFKNPKIFLPDLIEQEFVNSDFEFPHVMGFCLASLPE